MPATRRRVVTTRPGGGGDAGRGAACRRGGRQLDRPAAPARPTRRHAARRRLRALPADLRRIVDGGGEVAATTATGGRAGPRARGPDGRCRPSPAPAGIAAKATGSYCFGVGGRPSGPAGHSHQPTIRRAARPLPPPSSNRARGAAPAACDPNSTRASSCSTTAARRRSNSWGHVRCRFEHRGRDRLQRGCGATKADVAIAPAPWRRHLAGLGTRCGDSAGRGGTTPEAGAPVRVGVDALEPRAIRRTPFVGFACPVGFGGDRAERDRGDSRPAAASAWCAGSGPRETRSPYHARRGGQARRGSRTPPAGPRAAGRWFRAGPWRQGR